jgi:hypothetical protein
VVYHTASTITSRHHIHPTVTQNFQNLTQLQRCNSVRVHFYAYVPCWKVLKHFIYMIIVDMRRNQRWSTASTITSWHHLHLTVTQYCQNLTQLQRYNSIRVHLYHACLPHWKVLKHCIHVQYGCGKQSKVVYSLNHDIMALFPLNRNPELPRSDPASAVLQFKGTFICLRASLKGA